MLSAGRGRGGDRRPRVVRASARWLPHQSLRPRLHISPQAEASPAGAPGTGCSPQQLAFCCASRARLWGRDLLLPALGSTFSPRFRAGRWGLLVVNSWQARAVSSPAQPELAVGPSTGAKLCKERPSPFDSSVSSLGNKILKPRSLRQMAQEWK